MSELNKKYTKRTRRKLDSAKVIKKNIQNVQNHTSVWIVNTTFSKFYQLGRNFAETPIWQLAIKDGVLIFIVWFFFYKLACWNGLPFVLLLMTILVVIYAFVTSNTVAGRQIYALGGNRKAAQLSGIDTKKVFFWVYVNMGVLSALAGIVLAARNASATPKAGESFEMDAIASCYIGGAAVAGGAGTITGAVVGAFVMGILNNGMSLYGWSTDIQKIVKGAVLLGAVTLDVLSKRKKS